VSSSKDPGRSVSLVTLGCARNEVDSEELAARLEAAGWTLADGADADVVLVNTCGFIQAAKQESIDELLSAGSRGAQVVAAGCLAQRYGSELAEALPEAQVLGFDDYDDIGAKLDAVLAGQRWPAHAPGDRRRLLPVSPVARPGAGGGHLPGHGTVAPPDLPPGIAPASGPRVMRRRLDGGVVAPLKIASGCDRRCSFCAIPTFRGAFVSRPPQDLVAEAGWLAAQGASSSWSARTRLPTARIWAT
jgi:ribosomal protein S12 methylthiotransferase